MVSAIGDAVKALFEGEQPTEETNAHEIVASQDESDVEKFVPT